MSDIQTELELCRTRLLEQLELVIQAGLLDEALQVIKDSEEILGYDAELQRARERIELLRSECGQNVERENLRQEPPPKVLVGSVFQHPPQQVESFLAGLQTLDRSGLDVAFLFLDDNLDAESTRLLAAFAPLGASVSVLPASSVLPTPRTATLPGEAATWRKAALKDALLAAAHEQGCDYLLFVEPTLHLHPFTLRRLVSLGKSIVSPIVWHQGPLGLKVPQVWLRDANTRFNQGRAERLGPEESLVRQFRFFEALKRPGVYEVGGVKECMLISREALARGVSFREIANLSLPGDDTHFCIRASALGIPLHVDTSFPAHPLATEEERADLTRYTLDVARGRYPLRKKVALVHPNPSGSNTLALDKYTPTYVREEYEIRLIPFQNGPDFLAALLDADAVIVTDGSYALNKRQLKPRQVAIDLWHGFPLKALGWLDKNQPPGLNELLASRWQNLDWIGSYSPLFSEIMERCLRTGDPTKYRIVGAPRNDFLFRADGRRNLELALRTCLGEDRIVVYAPTYRSAPGSVRRNDADRDWANLFNMTEFDSPSFLRFLAENNITLVVKLHPAEESAAARHVSETGRVRLLTNAMLAQCGLDFYETLNAADVLITDYSSVFFDYLLLDRPMLFVPTDLEVYAARRGLLLEPYADWTPGPKVTGQAELEEEILRSLADPARFASARDRVASQVHSFRDDRSCDRVWEIVAHMLRERD